MKPLNTLDNAALNALKTAIDGYQRFEITHADSAAYFRKVIESLIGKVNDLSIWAIREQINREDERRSRVMTVKVRADVSDQISRLTQQELRILKLIGEGQTMENIADLLNISYRTLANHKASIVQKMGLGSAKNLIKFAIDNLTIL